MFRSVKALILPVVVAACLTALTAPARPASNDSRADCFSDDNLRRITGCTDLLDTPGLRPDEQAMAYAMRALAYSLGSRFSEAIRDYDSAIALNPDFSIALNNRAWALFKSGRAGDGMARCRTRTAVVARQSTRPRYARPHPAGNGRGPRGARRL